jgi:hypothetical protein
VLDFLWLLHRKLIYFQPAFSAAFLNRKWRFLNEIGTRLRRSQVKYVIRNHLLRISFDSFLFAVIFREHTLVIFWLSVPKMHFFSSWINLADCIEVLCNNAFASNDLIQ